MRPFLGTKRQSSWENLERFPSPYINWGYSLSKLGHHEKAIKRYREAVRIDPEYASAHTNWGISLRELGRHEEAIERYREAVRVDPEYAAAYISWGLTIAKIMKPDDQNACKEIQELYSEYSAASGNRELQGLKAQVDDFIKKCQLH